MKLTTIRNSVVVLLLVLLTNTSAYAKDKALLQNMIDLERVYIPALFLTSQELPSAIPAMNTFVHSWDNFRDEYWTYRLSQRNWISYFDLVQDHVDEAIMLVDGGHLLEAHEVLELVRTTLRDLRRRNGFPKFVTDELTAFHSIMGTIIAISKTDFDENTVASLSDLYKDGSHAWFKVEKNSVDQAAWGLSDVELMSYNNFVVAERNALDNFEMALASGDVATIKMTALGLKPAQAKAYLLLGDL